MIASQRLGAEGAALVIQRLAGIDLQLAIANQCPGIAHLLGAGQTLLDILAFLYVMLRIFYIMMYVSDMPTARSALWAAAFLVNIAILFIGYR